MLNRTLTTLVLLITLGAPLYGQRSVVPILELKLGAVLGGVKEGKFVDGVETAKTLKGGESYIVFSNINTPMGISVNKYGGKSTARLAPEQNDEVCPEFRAVEIDPNADSGIAIGKNADWDPVPRVVTLIDKSSPIYTRIVSTFLTSKGFTRPTVKIEEIYKVDLDGDGADEVVIRATNYGNFGPSAKKGEYSFVLLRKIDKGKGRDILLSGDFIDKDLEFGAPNRHEVSAIADLDGDGNMEIVIYGEYYEGSWAEVYKMKGIEPLKVLETGCGL